MTREGALVIIVLVAVGLLALLVWAWSRRSRRDAQPLVQAGELPEDARVVAVFEALYVATTAYELPLERIAAPGLGMRSRATLTVTDAGVAVDLTGQARFVLPTSRILAVGQSTVAIDRVVEPGGLTRLTWRTDADTVVDTYFRPQDASARALADAIADTLPTTTPTGMDA
ncbi:PH-like domain-containing protein [Microbacterium hominis]|uniref:PH domain-containing protein n=1 Tax=Microbacterium hominis TaxID=162426 RepID=A0A7D4Q140_9MICO|nr:hypothetical protein [Microbacterium hominis]QKJ19498.1 hypothetical protein HQM25_09085 [Microbacterium hominis]